MYDVIFYTYGWSVSFVFAMSDVEDVLYVAFRVLQIVVN